MDRGKGSRTGAEEERNKGEAGPAILGLGDTCLGTFLFSIGSCVLAPQVFLKGDALPLSSTAVIGCNASRK